MREELQRQINQLRQALDPLHSRIDESNDTLIRQKSEVLLAECTATLYDRLLASSCRPSVCLSVCL